MAEYKAIHGFTVQNRTADPKGTGISGASWSTGGNLNTARSGMGSGAVGNTGSAIAMGGSVSPSAQTELYNGTAWTEVGDLNTGRSEVAGTGLTTAALMIGQNPSTALVENWNGTSWTEIAEFNTARVNQFAVGSTTAALLVAGELPGPAGGFQDIVESWNGASWTEVGDLNTARAKLMGGGTSATAVIAGGQGPPNSAVAVNESWNGSSWTEVADLNTARQAAAAGSPSSTDFNVAGGKTGSLVGIQENWNGSAYTEIADMSTARRLGSGGGAGGTNQLVAGGNDGSVTAATEEFAAAGPADSIINTGQVFYRSDTGDMKVTLNVLGTGAWASGGNLNTARQQMGGAGASNSAAITFGGTTGSITNITESYNGTAYTEVADLNTARSALFGAVEFKL